MVKSRARTCTRKVISRFGAEPGSVETSSYLWRFAALSVSLQPTVSLCNSNLSFELRDSLVGVFVWLFFDCVVFYSFSSSFVIAVSAATPAISDLIFPVGFLLTVLLLLCCQWPSL